ncbi:nucleotidyltransferase family protein [Azospirillum himalayense]|uniref:Nucleotidyltransferase family protein n=1 Tax=Azospirillum himalayense TaxID=654847 RepID=A0ABW0G1P0_9PROT
MEITNASHPRYDDIRRRRLEERRTAALRALKQADAVARRAGGRLVVFGSLAEGGFHERSDLDVALIGVPAGMDSDVAADVDTLLTIAGFEADVIPDRFLSPSLRDRVMRHGCEPGALG